MSLKTDLIFMLRRMAVGTAHGYAVVDYKRVETVLTKCLLTTDGL